MPVLNVGMAKLTAVGPWVGNFVSSELLLKLDFPLRNDDVDGSQGSSLSLP